jgi:GTP cyclohydrolase II
LLPAATFNTLAKDLNKNAMQALNAMNAGAGAQAQENVALFSQTAIAALEGYLQSQRRDALATALTTNQQTVSEFASQMQSAVNIMALAAQNEYNAAFEETNRQVFTAATRAKVVDDLVALDRAYVAQVTMLQELHDAYGKVPAAHGQLAALLEESGQGLGAIVSVLEAGKRLQAKYGQSVTANRVASADATAAAAASRADAREAQAEAAALRAAAANAEAVAARLDANARPNDAAAATKATALEQRATDLAEEAERLRSEAAELRAAATAVRESADEIKRSAQGVTN